MLARLAQCIHRHQTPELFFVRKKKKNPLKFHHPEFRPDKMHVLVYFVTGSGLNLAEITISKKCLHHPYNNSLMAREHAKEAK